MNGRLLTASALACALAACASNPRDNSVLENARSAVQSAEADPNVSQYAALDLSRAKDELQAAEAAAAQHKDDDTTQHAYLATQNARIAQLHGQAKADDARVANGQAERDRVQLQARTREASQAQAAAAQANQQRDQLRAEMERLKATQTQRGMMMTLGDVLFDTGKSQLKSGAARKFDQLAQFLKDHPGRRVQIDGFTDSVGGDSYNEQLSEQRAAAVRNELTSRGIDAGRIGTRGYGKAFPVASNGAPSGRQLNRRVEVVIGNADDTPIAPRSEAP
jgi:outer membrane protein OmpA-like peptidoglycan-associated protein